MPAGLEPAGLRFARVLRGSSMSGVRNRRFRIFEMRRLKGTKENCSTWSAQLAGFFLIRRIGDPIRWARARRDAGDVLFQARAKTPEADVKKHFALALLLFAAGLTSAAAETWPARPVKVIVGFAAGGPTDLFARLIAQSSPSKPARISTSRMSAAPAAISVPAGRRNRRRTVTRCS